MGFVHLHVHSEYSLLDSMCRVRDLISRAVELGMPAIALTDHGVLSGAVKFYQEARDAGVKPILGCELYVAPGPRFERQPGKGEKFYHLVALAEDLRGWKNLVKLVNRAHLEGFYYKPRVDYELLERFSAGLVVLSACESGEVQKRLLAGDGRGALEAAGRLAEIFKGRFYIELQDHGLERNHDLIRAQLELARRLGLPVVATADVHYMRADDRDAHRVLINIQGGKKLSGEDARSFDGEDYHFLAPEEMARKFAEVPEALTNTLEIAERCDVELPLGERLLPHFPVPEGFSSPQEYLEHLAWEGARERFGDPLPPEVEERLRYELSVIGKMDLASYFLIVQDFVRYAREEGIPVGPGRGSAAGSLVTYCLGITQVDPLKYGLLFERFLNPSRISLPDIDMDFCIRGRDRVIGYVADRYGRDHLAQIGTFDRMASRSVVRDVARVMGLPYEKADIPFGRPLAYALEHVPQLKEMVEADAEVARLFEIALKLEGLLRNASTHAAGVVIAPEPLEEFVPLLHLSDGEFVTQFDMHDLEALGLLKMDFLGLRNLTILYDTRRLIAERTGEEIDLGAIPLDDEATYALIREGRTNGVFQLESAGMKALVRRLAPTEFRELIAILALYRPGPLESGMVDDYIERKHGRQPVTYPHPSLEEILRETYGLPIYQDQVMLMAQKLAGFSLAEADILRKAMGKKKPEVMAEMREKFVEGCIRNGLSPEEAEKLFADIEKFSSYAFAKAHAAAYAHITYWTAYFKAHYPTYFMAALLSSVQDNLDKVAAYIRECREMGIEVLPPDINESDVDFTPVGDKVIRFGLGAIKHVGRAAVEAILAVRGDGFRDFFDFFRRIDPERVNRDTVEALIKAGAMDRFGPRKGLLALVDEGLQLAQRAKRERLSGQRSFFDGEDLLPAPKLPADEFPPRVLLAFEREYLGLFISGHPLDAYEERLSGLGVVPLAQAGSQRGRFTVAGFVKEVSVKATRNGGRMAFLVLEDRTGEAELVVFPGVYEKAPGWFSRGNLLILKVRWGKRNGNGGRSLVVDEVQLLGGEEYEMTVSEVMVEIPLSLLDEAFLERFVRVLAEHPGQVPLIVVLFEDGRSMRVEAGERYRVSPSEELSAALQALGPGIRVRT
ncbi:MAG: DNA polymerase III subunit alpha [Caldiserica bacterium]|nr:DNA polymerase III subunit alpha [Caldisericota bacterium]